MSDEREVIAKLQAELAASQASTAKMAAEIEALRSKIWNRRSALDAGKLTEKLIAEAIAKSKQDGKRRTLSDGAGLHLAIHPEPGRGMYVSWNFRWSEYIAKNHYKQRAVGLGNQYSLSLADAREWGRRCRGWLRDGQDPQVEYQRIKRGNANLFRTVGQVIDEYLHEKIRRRSKKYYAQVEQRLNDYVRKHIGGMPIQSVTRQIVLQQVLKKDNFWDEKSPTAREVQLHLERMFGFAIFLNYYIGPNPAQWKNNLEHVLPSISEVHEVQNRPSLDFRELPEFVHETLRPWRYAKPRPRTGTDRPIVTYLIEFLLLTGVRLGEVVKARWGQFNTNPGTGGMKWNIPKKNTKSGKPRSVPITTGMLEILNTMQRYRFDLSDDAFVFPSDLENKPRANNPLGMQTPTRILREHFKVEFVNHGWRSTLKDWSLAHAHKACSEWKLEWWRMQCDHWEGVPRSDQAYGPDRLLNERRRWMQAYDDYATTPPAKAKLIPMKKRRSA
jgi:integrase